MIVRSIWRGYLRLALVTCAVELVNAIDAKERISFRTINRATGNTVRRQYVDSVTGDPVADDDEVKGYEVAENAFLLVERDEIESIQLASSQTMDLEGFLDRDEIPQLYRDHPYYVAPADEAAVEAFEVIRNAMQRSGKAGLTRIVLHGREHPAMVEPFDSGLLLTILRYEKAIRPPDRVFDRVRRPSPAPELVALAVDLIERKRAVFEPEGFEDAYEVALRGLIEAKQRGALPPPAAPPPPAPAVQNLLEALRRSIESERPRRTPGIRQARGLPAPNAPPPRRRA